MRELKPCRYNCGKMIYFAGISKSQGTTGWFEEDTPIEHTYKRCETLLKEHYEKELREHTSKDDSYQTTLI